LREGGPVQQGQQFDGEFAAPGREHGGHVVAPQRLHQLGGALICRGAGPQVFCTQAAALFDLEALATQMREHQVQPSVV
jgi:hypothetical protein